MAGRRGGARGLILGLALIAVGAALSQISVAEPLTRSGEQATPSKPSLFFGKARCAECHPAPTYTDDRMHDLRVEEFYHGRAQGLPG